MERGAGNRVSVVTVGAAASTGIKWVWGLVTDCIMWNFSIASIIDKEIHQTEIRSGFDTA